ncbi:MULTISPECIES: helix-turn-helix transcriptional regulator [Bradyrhizobium]|uniref:Helix-turn-helix transcriptional regulator n=2 Tax=Bradyrhizobium quebecense TaxID=2748629 RepID=A0ACD3VH75_9BRAD|nr:MULTISPECIES: helix-turn-helix transcriptional regulator [Bradyrhizobium]UFX46479.1 helix-turn-helix transcriptional regulator [Bradyrhizobium sp. 41S5]UGY05705.1 helix-turn-helix transcriptional regulator [Bradyrhizobium quebecense]
MERGAWRSHIAAAGGRAAHITGRGSCEQFDAPKCGAVLPSLINLARVLVEALSFFERTMPISSSCFYWVDAEANADHQQLRSLDSAWLRAYREEFHRCDPLHPRRWRAERGRVAALDGTAKLRDSGCRSYVDNFLLPQNTPYQAEIYFWQRDRMVAGMSLLRTGDLGAFTCRDIRSIESGLPLIDLSLSLLPDAAPLDGGRLKLTPREAEITAMVAAGDSNKLICRKLGIELPTVKTHLKRIFQKTGVGSRTELINKLYLARR